MKIILVTYFLLFSSHIFAQSVCERSFYRESSFLEPKTSRLSFKNRGGLFNGGVCWWHNRFQRAAAYLVEFRPDLPKPDPAQLQRILFEIKKMDRVVILPGFEDLYSFSRSHQKEIQQLLDIWQREDGFLSQQWIRGISGKFELNPRDMKKRMDTLYQQFIKSPHPIWIMAQIKGITSHSFLVLDMRTIPKGYKLKMIDSNKPTETKIYSYGVGQRFLKYPKDKYSFVPYLGFQKDFIAIKHGIDDYCGSNFMRSKLDTIPMGEIEVGH